MRNIKIQSDTSYMNEVECLLDSIADEMNLGDNAAAVNMAVSQAIKNAIVHGNRCDKAKCVTLEYGQCTGGLFFEVSDEGDGFDFASYGTSVPQEGRGEGLFMIRMLSDKVDYFPERRCLRMEFLVNGIQPSISRERIEALHRSTVGEAVNV